LIEGDEDRTEGGGGFGVRSIDGGGGANGREQVGQSTRAGDVDER